MVWNPKRAWPRVLLAGAVKYWPAWGFVVVLMVWLWWLCARVTE